MDIGKNICHCQYIVQRLSSTFCVLLKFTMLFSGCSFILGCKWHLYQYKRKYVKVPVTVYSRRIFTVRLHVMQRTVLLSQFCLSVRLSVCLSIRCVYCDKTKQRTANILIPHETAITLVFWHQQWLVGDASFALVAERANFTFFE